jgi:hypothetical protein
LGQLTQPSERIVTPPDASPPSERVSPEAARHAAEETTGLPLLHTWRSVYLFVLGSFVLWVLLLVALSLVFR